MDAWPAVRIVRLILYVAAAVLAAHAAISPADAGLSYLAWAVAAIAAAHALAS